MNRRGFLKLTTVLGVVAVTPITLKAAGLERLPVIHGDGMHDDSEGIRAAIRGEPFVCRDCDVRQFVDKETGRRIVYLGPGTYRMYPL